MEDMYELWGKLEDFITPKDKKDAMLNFIEFCYDHDGNLFSLMEMAEECGDSQFVKATKKFIKENGIEEDEWNEW